MKLIGKWESKNNKGIRIHNTYITLSKQDLVIPCTIIVGLALFMIYFVMLEQQATYFGVVL